MSTIDHEKIHYVELPVVNLAATKAFFQSVFSWKFQDYGADYTAFSNAGLEGGFYRAEKSSTEEKGGALVIGTSD